MECWPSAASTRSTGLDSKLRGPSPVNRRERINQKMLGAVAQLGERLICIQEVAGSIPTSSTSYYPSGPVAQLVRAHP